MSKTSISARINTEIVKWLDKKAGKDKTRSEVLNDLLEQAMAEDQNSNGKLDRQSAKASIMSFRILEQFVKQACDNPGEIMAIAKQKFDTDFPGG